MLSLELAYGKTGLPIELPDDADVTVLEPKYVDAVPDQTAALRQALQAPIDAPPLSELVESSDRVAITFSDITRPTPNHLLIPALVEQLPHVPPEQITLYNGTGTHRANTEPELREMLGDEVVDRYPIVQNDATDKASHVRVGLTENGNEVWIHRGFVESGVRILTGFIEPHFFAGFSGGGKAVMPGLALLETVLRNHSAEHMDSPHARWGITEGNPLWEEVREAARMVDPTFLLNVSLNRDKLITNVFAGNWEEAHARGCDFVKETAMVAVEEPFDIVITSNSGYPLDLNLYQSVKGMSAAAQIVKQGGDIVIAADCWDGVPEHGNYAEVLLGTEDLDALLETVRDPKVQKQDKWQAHIQALIARKADVHFYSHNLTADQIEAAHLTACADVNETIGALLDKHGPGATVCVLPEGPMTIPYIGSKNG